MLIAVRERNGARFMIRITLQTGVWKEDRMTIEGNSASAETAVLKSAGGRVSVQIRSYLKRPTFKDRIGGSSSCAGRRTVSKKDRCVIQLCWEAHR